MYAKKMVEYSAKSENAACPFVKVGFYSIIHVDGYMTKCQKVSLFGACYFDLNKKSFQNTFFLAVSVNCV